MSHDETVRSLSRPGDGDFLAFLAAADAAEEAGDAAGSHRLRCRAEAWRWADSYGDAWKLCYVHGKGAAPLVAYFCAGDEREADGPGWAERNYLKSSLPPASGCVRVLFESPSHIVPADGRALGRLSVRDVNAQRAPWLAASGGSGAICPPHWAAMRFDLARSGGDDFSPEYVAPAGRNVYAGCAVARFCREVERGGGWWWPMSNSGESHAQTEEVRG